MSRGLQTPAATTTCPTAARRSSSEGLDPISVAPDLEDLDPGADVHAVFLGAGAHRAHKRLRVAVGLVGVEDRAGDGAASGGPTRLNSAAERISALMPPA